MIRRLYAWHVKQRRFKLFKGNLLVPMKTAQEPFRFRLFRGRGRPYYFASEGRYVYEKSATRRFFRYLFLGLALVGVFIWVVIECYKGWSVFSF